MDVKFTSRDSCDNAYFSLKDLSIELLESVIEALHDESNIVLVLDFPPEIDRNQLQAMVHHQLDRLFTPTRARRVGSTSTSSIPILIVVFCVIVIEISGSSRRDTIRAGVNQGKHNEVLAEGLNGVPDNCDIAAVGADEGSIRTRREHFGQAVLAEAMATLKLFKQEISLGGVPGSSI
ncbi:hypothetical protein ACFX14_028293 [Malus domestica]